MFDAAAESCAAADRTGALTPRTLPATGREFRVDAALAFVRGLGDDVDSEVPEPAVSVESAAATTGVDAIHTPTPRATAKAPTRPTEQAEPAARSKGWTAFSPPAEPACAELISSPLKCV
jgi:hypothetical protein